MIFFVKGHLGVREKVFFFFFLSRVPSLFLYYFKSNCDPMISQFSWSFNQSERRINQKFFFGIVLGGGGGLKVKSDFS